MWAQSERLLFICGVTVPSSGTSGVLLLLLHIMLANPNDTLSHPHLISLAMGVVYV